MSIFADNTGITIRQGTITGESVETAYELTLVLAGKVSTLQFGNKPSENLIEQLIELTGAYKATLKAIKTTTTEYQGKSMHTFKLDGNSDIWKTGWVMENSDTTLVGGKTLGY